MSRPQMRAAMRLCRSVELVRLHDGHPSRRISGGFPLAAKQMSDKELGVVVDVFHERWDEDGAPCNQFYAKLLIGETTGWINSGFLVKVDL